MYAISQACKTALNGQRMSTKVEGILKLNNGMTIPLESKDFSQGELSINNRCVSGNDFEYGAVYCAELIASIQTDADRYLFYNGKISITVYVMLADGSWEGIPMGIYNITEAERTGKKVEIKAYDNMLLMGDPIDLEITDITGRPYEILSAITEMSGIRLNQSQEAIEAFPNGNRILKISVSDGEITPRDVLSELCVLLCAFAIFDRQGNLEIRQYGTECVYTAPGRKKTNTKISDYVVRYKGVKAQVGNKYMYKTDDTVPGLILDIGSNSFLQQGLESTKEDILQEIANVLLTVNYTPCSTELMTGYPALDLGDLIEVEDQYGSNIVTYVMSYNWKYRGRHTIKGVGSNPRMNVKGQTEKALADLAGSFSAKDVIVRTYTNLKALSVKDTKAAEIISINFASVANAKPIFLATIPVIMSLDGYVVLTYHLDGVQLPEDTLRMYLARGEHFLTITNHLEMEADKRLTLTVKMQTAYHESDTRQQAARIASIEDYINTGTYTLKAVDTTPPAATIPKGAIKAVLYAQGLAGTDMWDGTINVAEYVTAMDISGMPLAGLSADIVLAEVPRTDKGIPESIRAFALSGLPIVALDSSVSLDALDATEENIEESGDETI